MKRIILINILVFLGLLGALEIISRLTFPEFKDNIFSEAKTMNINYFDGDFHGYQVRVPNYQYKFREDIPTVLIFGDSITGGYGTAYEDIWWRKLENFLRIKGVDLQIIGIAGYGNNTDDALRAIKAAQELSSVEGIKISKIIYQFNFNDILPFSSSDLEATAVVNTDLFSKFSKWRSKHLNKSVLMRAMQHYAGAIVRKTSGSCEERGFHALGPYTWTFGSKQFTEDAEYHWEEFEKSLFQIKDISDQINSKFEIFISPILFDVDKSGAHPYYNYLNYDFSCATIQPRDRLLNIAQQINIPVYDPAEELESTFKSRLEAGNFSPYFFASDENHFTPLTGTYIAEFIAMHWN